MAPIEDFTFGTNDDQIGNKAKKWKGEGGRAYRLSFINWPGLEDGKLDLDAPGPNFKKAPGHYIEGVGYVMNNGPEYTKLIGTEPRNRIVTIVVVWPTDKEGEVSPERLAAGEAEVLLWVISDDKYLFIRKLNKEFHFGQFDLGIDCKDTKFQKMEFIARKDSLLRKLQSSQKGQVLLNNIILKAQNLIPAMERELGRDLTIEQLKSAMAGGSTNAPSTASTGRPDAASDVNLDDVLDTILD